MQELYQLYEKADGIILGSPVYFHNVSAQLKNCDGPHIRFADETQLERKSGGRDRDGAQSRRVSNPGYDFTIISLLTI